MSKTENYGLELDRTSDADVSESDEDLQHRLQKMISLLTPLSAQSRTRLMGTVMTFFGDVSPSSAAPKTQVSFPPSKFSADRSLSPKEFLLEKLPRSDVERVVCLAYYLTHYREAPYFKTIDISLLNTEAAQRKFSNAAAAVRNAGLCNFLAPAPMKGKKQISAGGELFVLELPDRSAAKAAMAAVRPRKKSPARKRASNKKKKKTSE